MKTSTVALVALTFCIGVLASDHAAQGKREAFQTDLVATTMTMYCIELGVPSDQLDACRDTGMAAYLAR